MVNWSLNAGSTQPQSANERLQHFGKSFMLPIAALAFCGIILGIGTGLSNPQLQAAWPWLGNQAIVDILGFLKAIGSVVVNHLPLLFAMAIPLGMARQDQGVAALSGAVAYLAHLYGMQACASWFNLGVSHHFTQVLGIQAIDTGVLGGVLLGLMVLKVHERYRQLELPDAFAFFSGARSVPINSLLFGGLAGLFVPLVWPIVAGFMNGLGYLVSASGIFGPFLFGLGESLLRPLGLHHLLVQLVRLTAVGGRLQVNGRWIEGALNIFYAQAGALTEAGFSPQITRFLSQGKMPAYMGGLPGAALAMYCAADKKNRSKTKGLLLSGVVASVVGGITEPLEFIILALSPTLYCIHAALVGLGFMMMGLLQVTIGNTDGNVIDLLVWGVLQGTQTRWPLAVLMIAIWFGVYYVVFSWLIRAWDLKTPGRNEESMHTALLDTQTLQERAPQFLAALGGAGNIQSLDNCLTRLRLSVLDPSRVNQSALLALGALGVVQIDTHNFQVVIGTKVQTLKDAIFALLQAKAV